METRSRSRSRSTSQGRATRSGSNPLPAIPPVRDYKQLGSRTKFAAAESWSDRFLSIFLIPIRAAICFSNVTVFFLAYFGFMLPMLWARSLWPRLYWFYEGKLYRWLQAFIGYWGYTAGYDVYEFGDDISLDCVGERTVVMINHQSTADVPVMMAVLQNKGVTSRKTLWLMDVMFRWTPFGIVGRMHGDYFIQQGKATRDKVREARARSAGLCGKGKATKDKEIGRLKRHLREVFWDRDRRWVLLFPEGGFYYKRVESSQKYGETNGFPHLLYTTLPRQGAVQAILEEIGPRHDSDSSSSDTNTRPRTTSKLKLLKDTVDAIREKKYLKGTL
ncbi:acl-14 [Pristionchus pacificus]|uniref:Acl-14 n=1 Tax=Pristionchus pacificus TaxID=54126 RepID=A0A2A6C6A7_PRIPA|nr:acl-14 [Pristionchus pacificus]|eukprot:PDM73647.1 acl-14 [Pristionchus pacificus]